MLILRWQPLPTDVEFTLNRVLFKIFGALPKDIYTLMSVSIFV